MPISVKCGACGAAFAVRDEIGGKLIRCVGCKEAIRVARSAEITGTAAEQPLKQSLSPKKAAQAAPLKTSSKDPESLRKKIFASFTSPAIQPVPIAWSYRIGIVLTSLLMIMLPLIYVGMIFGAGWLVFYHAMNHTDMISAASQATSGRNSASARRFR